MMTLIYRSLLRCPTTDQTDMKDMVCILYLDTVLYLMCKLIHSTIGQKDRLEGVYMKRYFGNRYTKQNH